MGIRKVQQGFTAGELSPKMYGRFEDPKYAQGLAKCRNMIVCPQGPVTFRPGLAYVREVKDSATKVRLFPFTFSRDQTMVLEFGEKYIRFHTMGQTLLGADGEPYEVESPYAADDLFDIHYVQSMDVMTLVHPSYAPRELKRYGATDWRLTEIQFTSAIDPPDAPVCTFNVVAGSGVTITDAEKTRYDYKYVVTALTETEGGTAESEASEPGECKGNLYLNNSGVDISWDAVPGATRYRVYRSYQGLYCYIGETEDTSFVDDNYKPDAGVTPPRHDDPFNQAKGITSVEVLAGGSGYEWVNGAIAIGDPPYKATSVGKDAYPNTFTKWDADEINLSEISGTARNTNMGGSNPSYPAYPGFPTFTASVTDAAGHGSGAQVEMEFTDTHSRATGSTSISPRVQWRYAQSRSTRRLKAVRITNLGKGYIKPQLTVSWSSQLFSRGETETRYYAVRVDLGVYTGGTELQVSDTTGTGAVLRPVIVGGVIQSVVVENGGSNYTEPTVSVVSDTGTGAQLKATVGAVGDYPGAVCYYEQRRGFGGTMTRPQTLWLTRTGTENDMSFTIPTQDDNRVKFRIAAQEASRILHLVPLSQLLILTESTEYRAKEDITPTSIDIKPQTYIGASNVQPVVVNSTMVYTGSRDGHPRELGYNWQASGFTTGDLAIRSEHFFETARVTDMALQKAPDSIVWMVLDDGRLIGLTYLPEQAVAGWHQHDTQGGAFESVACVSEGTEDVIYCVVRRTFGTVEKRFIERMHERGIAGLGEAFHVDCGGTYRGIATDVVSGLTWLEGEEVSILADGAVLPRRTVEDGKVHLQTPAAVVHVGLPIEGDLQTLPLAVQLQDGSLAQGHMKNVNELWIRVYKSSGVFAGPDFDRLKEVKQRTTEPYGTPPDLMSREAHVVVTPSWGDSGQVCIRQADPLPLTVLSICYDLAR